MLKKLKIMGFKSLKEVEIDFPMLTVLFGPNTSGKSNILDAVQALSRIGTCRTLMDALSEPIRGYPIESFAFPPGGLPELLSQDEAHFKLEADLMVDKDSFRYRVGVTIRPGSGSLAVEDEYLAPLMKRGDPKKAIIEKIEDQLRIRRRSVAANPRRENLPVNYSMLSDPRLSGQEYRPIERCRKELLGWRVYYLDPRMAMRSARPPTEVQDIGMLGEDVAPFLYRLRADKPKSFDMLIRTLKSLIPSIEDLSVDLDKKRGTLDISVKQYGMEFSSRIISEGTLRILALCAVAVNPWSGSLLAFEEPENGVHPRRLELIAELIASLALDQKRQIIVTTHSPLFCDAILKRAKDERDKIVLLNVKQREQGSQVNRFETGGPLFDGQQLDEALTVGSEDGLFQSLIMRGLIDG